MKTQAKTILVVSTLFTLTILSCKKDKETLPTPMAPVTTSENHIVNMPCLPTNLPTGVIAFYPFNGGSLNDYSGNNYNLSNNSTAHSGPDRNGNPNCAFEFNNLANSNEFIRTSNTTFLNALTQFSVSLWYQPLDSTRNGASFEGLVSRGQIGSCPDRMGDWSVALYDCRRAVFGRQNSVWDNVIVQNSFNCEQEVVVRTGSWHHLVATYNQTNNEMKIYRDGVLQDTKTGIANCGNGIPAIQDLGDLFLGKNYTGRLDDVFIFNRTLTTSDVSILYGMGTCCSN